MVSIFISTFILLMIVMIAPENTDKKLAEFLHFRRPEGTKNLQRKSGVTFVPYICILFIDDAPCACFRRYYAFTQQILHLQST